MPDRLARAIEELRFAQGNLAAARSLPLGARTRASLSRRATDRVLAALSWVWDEQERAAGHL